MSFNNFMKRIVCFSISSIMFANNSFASRIIINNSSKSSQLKNEKKPAKNNTFGKKKYIISEIFGWGTAALNTFFIKKLYNALFLNQYTKPNPVTSKKDSPFANLKWHENNCYIDATLQILYEDKEFRKYVEEQSNNASFGNMFLEDQNEHNKKYISLYQIFEDMDKYKGDTVPYNDARQDFEQALGHSGSADAYENMFAKIYPCDEWIICDNNETKKVEITAPSMPENNLKIKDLTANEYERDSLWFTCNATSKDDRQSLPMELTFKNNKKFKLKGVVMYGRGHYTAYKTDENGQWYFIDDIGKKNAKYGEKPDFKAVYMGYDPETNECSYAPGVQLAYYQAVTT